ncbi:MAG: TauD/TfdA family dioxygenase [Inquilinus sp.]|nr:TauD/TfdA family dioxygenase [Inquilinus sp.]
MPQTLTATSPAAWTARDFAGRDDWIIRLGAARIAEIDAALAIAEATGRPLEAIRRADFPLPSLSRTLAGIAAELKEGRGFVLIRGLPVERYGEGRAALAFWGLGTHLGTAVSQSRKGDMLGHVRDLGGDIADPLVRGYETRARLLFHTDRCDCVGLLCLQKPKSGGASRVVSAPAVRDAIARDRPDLLAVLHRPFCADRRGEEPPGERGWVEMPVFMEEDGTFAVRYVRDYIEGAQRFAEVPRLTPEQVAALDLFDRTAADPALALDMAFEPGDMQFLNNYRVLHARTAFEDHAEPARRRHLLRLWLAMSNSRRLPRAFLGLYDTIAAGAVRGGVPPRPAG